MTISWRSSCVFRILVGTTLSNYKNCNRFFFVISSPHWLAVRVKSFYIMTHAVLKPAVLCEQNKKRYQVQIWSSTQAWARLKPILSCLIGSAQLDHFWALTLWLSLVPINRKAGFGKLSRVPLLRLFSGGDLKLRLILFLNLDSV